MLWGAIFTNSSSRAGLWDWQVPKGAASPHPTMVEKTGAINSLSVFTAGYKITIPFPFKSFFAYNIPIELMIMIGLLFFIKVERKNDEKA
jgi:hypothetical protein